MISQGYTPYCAALSPHHTVGVCEWDVQNATQYRRNGYMYSSTCTGGL